MYAILDIETTGGKYNEEGITEIAIYRFDGQKMVDSFSSLINPLIEIQPYVQQLTGINNKMLIRAPKFFELAKRIIEITENCILVAHNTSFDYRILRVEFNRLGYDYIRETLCTVQLSQKLIPEAPSHSLGKLVRSLGIPITNRHRAEGDALATLELFKILLQKDTEKQIASTLIQKIEHNPLRKKFLSLVEKAPSRTGVYYFYDSENQLFYIGQSSHIKKQVRNLLIASNKKAKLIQKKITNISFELTGNQLISLLKKHNELTKNSTNLDSKLNASSYTYGIYISTATPHFQFVIENIKKNKNYLLVFKSKMAGYRQRNFWTSEFELDSKKESCSVNEYNQLIEHVSTTTQFPHPTMLLIDKGKSTDEKSFIYIKNNHLIGYGFYKLNHQINNTSSLEKRLVPIEHNSVSKTIILNAIEKKKYQKIIPLTP